MDRRALPNSNAPMNANASEKRSLFGNNGNITAGLMNPGSWPNAYTRRTCASPQAPPWPQPSPTTLPIHSMEGMRTNRRTPTTKLPVFNVLPVAEPRAFLTETKIRHTVSMAAKNANIKVAVMGLPEKTGGNKSVQSVPEKFIIGTDLVLNPSRGYCKPPEGCHPPTQRLRPFTLRFVPLAPDSAALQTPQTLPRLSWGPATKTESLRKLRRFRLPETRRILPTTNRAVLRKSRFLLPTPKPVSSSAVRQPYE